MCDYDCKFNDHSELGGQISGKGGGISGNIL